MTSGPLWLRVGVAAAFAAAAMFLLTLLMIAGASSGSELVFVAAIRGVCLFIPFENVRPAIAGGSGLSMLYWVGAATFSAVVGRDLPMRQYAFRSIALFLLIGLLIEGGLLLMGIRRHLQLEF